MALALCLLALPIAAQRRVDLLVDAEGARRPGRSEVVFRPNETRYTPDLDDAGGVGGGVRWFFAGRFALELKVAGLASRLHVRRTGRDFFSVANLGYAQLYPITAIAQWHLNEHGALRPYLGAGVVHVILRNIDKPAAGFTGVRFDDPTGALVDAGLLVPLTKRWSLAGDARYIPIETTARARFAGTAATAEIDVKPLIVSVGITYHY